jgi:thymidylate synthase ThyX
MTKIEAKVLLDSQFGDDRLTTMELTYPRFVHAEYMTHRVFSRNAASSRAIPVAKMISNIVGHPVVPIHWGANQKGMQAFQELSPEAAANCEELWLKGLEQMLAIVEGLRREGLHKQIANRLLEPWMHITVIHSATQWDNFFKLRCHGMAEPHMQALAMAMKEAYEYSYPTHGRSWHLPLIGFEGDEQLSFDEKKLVSVARCARVSYLTHEGTRDVQADLKLAETLRTNGHFSPWEHVAHHCPGRHGNFQNWRQLRWYVERRKELPS